jgi:hypothetical protein
MKLLSTQTVFSYLIEQNLCLAEDDAPIAILPLSGKNMNLRLKFAKQEAHHQHGCSHEFANEWAAQLIFQQPELQSLRNFIPRLQHYDAQHSVLVGPYLSDYDNLSDYYDCGDGDGGDDGDGDDSVAPVMPQFDPAIARSIGQQLGQLHRLTWQNDNCRAALQAQSSDLIIADCPMNLAPIEPLSPEIFGWVRDDGLMFFRWYQSQPELIATLQALAAQWQPTCVIHQDLKFGNWLLHRDWQLQLPQALSTATLQLIDWEKMGWGDPIGDLAQMLAAYLELWLDSIPAATEGNWADRLAAAAVPIAAICPSIKRLLRSYFGIFPELLVAPHQPPDRLWQWVGRYLIAQVQRDIEYHEPLDGVAVGKLQLAKQFILQPRATSSQLLTQF